MVGSCASWCNGDANCVNVLCQACSFCAIREEMAVSIPPRSGKCASWCHGDANCVNPMCQGCMICGSTGAADHFTVMNTPVAPISNKCASWCHGDANCVNPMCQGCDICLVGATNSMQLSPPQPAASKMCASWCNGDGSCGSVMCGGCAICAPDEGATANLLHAEALACASWCQGADDCFDNACHGCDACSYELDAASGDGLDARIDVAEKEPLVEDLETYMCASWCHSGEGNCGNPMCKGCQACDLRPHVCLIWGLYRSQLGHPLGYFCQIKEEAADWCSSQAKQAKAMTDPDTQSQWVLTARNCCEGERLTGNVGCPQAPPGPKPPPPLSPPPPLLPPPSPLPPAPSPPPAQQMQSASFSVVLSPNVSEALVTSAAPPLGPRPPSSPPVPPAPPPLPFFPLSGMAVPDTDTSTFAEKTLHSWLVPASAVPVFALIWYLCRLPCAQRIRTPSCHRSLATRVAGKGTMEQNGTHGVRAKAKGTKSDADLKDGVREGLLGPDDDEYAGARTRRAEHEDDHSSDSSITGAQIDSDFEDDKYAERHVSV